MIASGSETGHTVSAVAEVAADDAVGDGVKGRVVQGRLGDWMCRVAWAGEAEEPVVADVVAAAGASVVGVAFDGVDAAAEAAFDDTDVIRMTVTVPVEEDQVTGDGGLAAQPDA